MGFEPSDPPVGYLDLYRVAVEQVDHISSRRNSANQFYLGLHAAVLTVTGLIRPLISASTPPPYDPLPTVVACLAGIALSGAWWMSLRSYRDINKAKFTVIMDMEKRLPAKIFTDEWTQLEKDKIKPWRGRYAELGFVERGVPVIFVVLYVFVLWSAVWRT